MSSNDNNRQKIPTFHFSAVYLDSSYRLIFTDKQYGGSSLATRNDPSNWPYRGVCAFMRTLPLAGNRRASIRFKSGASNSHASTRIPRNTCTLVEGKRVHTTRQRLVKHDDGAWTLYTNRKFNKGSSTGTVHHCKWIRVQHLGNLIV